MAAGRDVPVTSLRLPRFESFGMLSTVKTRNGVSVAWQGSPGRPVGHPLRPTASRRPA